MPRVERAGEALDLIRQGRARTIGELAVAMDLARSTVVQRIDHLVAAGLVVAGPALTDSPGRGRPAAVLQFNPTASVVLVAQLGMTGSQVAVTDLDGAVLAQRFVPFPAEAGTVAVMEHVAESLTAILDASGRAHRDVRGIGVGIPSAIEMALSMDPVRFAEQTWDRNLITEELRRRFGVPTFSDNDVNLLALGEQRSAWPDTEVLLCLKVGTVIGCGTVIRGEAVSGAQDLAGSIGHIAVAGQDTVCACGNVGCLDAVAGGAVLVAQLQAAGVPVRDVRHLAAMARDGVPEAVAAVRTAGRHIGEVLAYAVNLLNPGVIALWGYLAEADAELLAGIRETVYKRSLPAATRHLQLVPARLGDSAGVVGAAMMVVSQILSPAVLDDQLGAWMAQRQEI